jgi:hypothetical protein
MVVSLIVVPVERLDYYNYSYAHKPCKIWYTDMTITGSAIVEDLSKGAVMTLKTQGLFLYW